MAALLARAVVFSACLFIMVSGGRLYSAVCSKQSCLCDERSITCFDRLTYDAVEMLTKPPRQYFPLQQRRVHFSCEASKSLKLIDCRNFHRRAIIQIDRCLPCHLIAAHRSCLDKIECYPAVTSTISLISSTSSSSSTTTTNSYHVISE